ncbi:MAG: signal peptidase I [Solirubrobacteraceae bacterium]
MAEVAASKKRARGPVGTVLELLVTVAVAISLALLIQALVVKPYRIPTPSMVPTLAIGQRVLVNRLDTHPGLGDIVVFHPPAGADPQPAICANPRQGADHPQACDQPTAQASTQTFIKRLVGLPGDRISIADGHVIRNGVQEKAPYAQPCGGVPGCNFRKTIAVPRDDYYMMGDNRGRSDDSRFWGPVPQKWIIGIAFFTYWPPGRIGIL